MSQKNKGRGKTKGRSRPRGVGRKAYKREKKGQTPTGNHGEHYALSKEKGRKDISKTPGIKHKLQDTKKKIT